MQQTEKVIHDNKYLRDLFLLRLSFSYCNDETYPTHFQMIQPSDISTKTAKKEKKIRSIVSHTFSSVSSGRVTSLAFISSVSGGKNFS